MSGVAAPSTAPIVDQMSSPQEPAYEMKSEGEEGLGTPLDPLSGLTSTEEGLAPVVPEEKDVIPEGGYGWVIVICVALINAVTWGVNTTYGVFSSFYQEYDYFNATVLDYAWVGGLSVAVSLVVAPLSNWITREYGFKVSMTIGMVFVVLGQCLAGLFHSFGPFLVFQGVIFGIGLGLTFIAVVPVAAHWFDRRLALAQGLSAAGSGLGGLILSNTTRAALESLGVKWALIINGLISLAVMAPCIWLLKGRHKAVKARSAPFQVKWFVHPGLIWVLGWGVFAMMAYFIALYSLASFATAGLGLTQTQGAALQAILSAGQIVGRPGWGFVLDYGGRLNMTIVCYIICGLSSLVIWLPANSFGLLAFFAIVQGLTGGTIWSAVSPVTKQVVGVQDLASALSIIWITLTVPALVGQPIAVALLDYSRNQLGRTGAEAYYISIGMCGGMAIFSAILLCGAKIRSQGNWKIWQKI